MTATTTSASQPAAMAEPARPDESPDTGRRHRLMAALVVLVLAVSIAIRGYTRSPLWLDEALTVNIASLPLHAIPAALREDGAPPLYYVLLHGWLQLFGTSAVAARSLSAVFSVATLPLAYLAGRREGGRIAAWGMLLLLATSPFAVHYATEARMYSLAMLLVTAGYLLLRRAIEAPTLPRLAPLPLVSAALAYTHYWSLFLLAVVGALLLAGALRSRSRRVAYRKTLLALSLGAVLFLPWLPTFLFQAAHTGTPWAQPAQYAAIVAAVSEWAGGGSNQGRILALLYLALTLAGLLGRRIDDRRMLLEIGPPREATALLVAFAGTIALGLTAGLAAGSGFAGRYTIVAFLPFLLLVVRGLLALPTRAVVPLLALATAAGLGTSLAVPVDRTKTDADLVAQAIRAQARPGDVVAYCPDQLGPSVSRLLPHSLRQEVFPTGGPPYRIDWVDYAQRNLSADPKAFAQRLQRQAGATGTIWLVYAGGYRTFEGQCEAITAAMSPGYVGRTLVAPIPGYFEHPALLRFQRVHP